MAIKRGKVNKGVLRRQVRSAVVKSKKTKDFVYSQTAKDFERKKQKLISDFENHPVTEEIAAGAKASNRSGTLGGYGNLFSFIGFDSSADPISPVRAMLTSGTRLLKKATIKTVGDNLIYQFSVRYPSKEQLASVSPMPWEPGSWLLKIEKGISGLGYYIYNNYLEKSRSGTGVQAKNKVNPSGIYRRKSYISLILKTFEKNLR